MVARLNYSERGEPIAAAVVGKQMYGAFRLSHTMDHVVKGQEGKNILLRRVNGQATQPQ